MTFQYFESPIGRLRIEAEDGAIRSIGFSNDTMPELPDDATREAVRQLTSYFSSALREFHLNCAPKGTAFQRKVWEEMRAIPFGSTISYGQLAQKIGRPKAYRAVANACGANPILIVQPCHRVTASNGIGGFSCGIDVKKQLMTLENILF